MENTTIDLEKRVLEIMSSNFISVRPHTSMLDIKEIFDKEDFHHIPVLNDESFAVGIVSRSDYNKLLHHFTLFKLKDAEINNERFFRSLIAKDFMTKDPICVLEGTTIKEALKMFMVNRFHCLLINSSSKCIGIVTPYDFLDLILNQ